MRFLVLIESLSSVGGMERSALELAEELASRGHAIALLHGGDGPLRARWAKFASGIIEVPAMTPSRRQPLPAAMTIARTIGVLWTVRPDVVHLHSWRQLQLWRAVHAFAPPGTKCVLHLRTEFVEAARRLAPTLRRVDQMIAVSRAAATSWSTALGIESDRIIVITNGIRPRGTRPPDHDAEVVRSEARVPNEDHLVVYLGRLAAAKGIGELLTAHAEARAAGRKQTLLIVGDAARGDREFVNSLRRDTPAGVIWHGPVDDGEPYVAAADVVVLPSHAEGLPRTLIEALQAGTPVVATDVGGIPEVMLPELAEFMVPARESFSLQAAITRALDSPPHAGLLRTVGARFDVGHVAADFERAIECVRADSPAPRGGPSMLTSQRWRSCRLLAARIAGWHIRPTEVVLATLRLAERLEAGSPTLGPRAGRLVRYRLARRWGVFVHPDARVGAVTFAHPAAIVIGAGAAIGDGTTIYQNVTLGRTDNSVGGYPTVGRNVTVFAGAVLIGEITIGDGAVIGANSVVTRDVGAGETVVGAPARAVKGRSTAHGATRSTGERR